MIAAESAEFGSQLALPMEGSLICAHNPLIVVWVDTLRPRLERLVLSPMRGQLIEMLVHKDCARIVVEDGQSSRDHLGEAVEEGVLVQWGRIVLQAEILHVGNATWPGGDFDFFVVAVVTFAVDHLAQHALGIVLTGAEERAGEDHVLILLRLRSLTE